MIDCHKVVIKNIATKLIYDTLYVNTQQPKKSLPKRQQPSHHKMYKKNVITVIPQLSNYANDQNRNPIKCETNHKSLT